MRNSNPLVILFTFLLSATTAFSQANISAGLSYGSFNYDISGTKYTGDGGVLNLDGQLSPAITYSLSMGDGKFDDVVLNNSDGSLSYSVLFLLLYINTEEYDAPYFSNIFVINFWLEIFMIAFYPIIRELIRILFQYIHKKVWENIIKEQSKQNNDTKLKNVTEIV